MRDSNIPYTVTAMTAMTLEVLLLAIQSENSATLRTSFKILNQKNKVLILRLYPEHNQVNIFYPLIHLGKFEKYLFCLLFKNIMIFGKALEI